jgi:hypothetical protein
VVEQQVLVAFSGLRSKASERVATDERQVTSRAEQQPLISLHAVARLASQE